MKRVVPLGAAAAFAAVGVLLSLWRGGRPSVWFDELATASSIDRSPGQLWRMVTTDIDAVHGLYYFALRPFAAVFGMDPAALRAFSAIGVGCAAAACYLLARRLGGPWFGVLGGVLALILPRLTWSGVEARSYSWVIAAAAVVVLAGHRAAASGRRRDWATYAVALAGATVLFLYAGTLAAGILAAVAWSPVGRRVQLKNAAIASGLGLVLASPVAVLAATQRDQVGWLQWPGWRLFQNVFIDQWFDHSYTFAVVSLAIVAVAAVLWWRRGVPPGLVGPLRWGVATALVPLGVILLVSTVAPSYVGRYLSFTVPGAVLVLASAVATVASALPRPRVAATIVLAALVAAAVPGYLWQRTPLAKPGGSDFTYAAKYIRDNANPGDCVLFQVQPSWSLPSLRMVHDGLPGMFDGLTDMGPGGENGDRRTAATLWDQSRGVNQWAGWAAENCTTAWVLADADRAEDDFHRENGNLWWTFRQFQFMGTDMQVQLDYGGLAVVHQEQFHILQVVKLVRPAPAVGPDPQLPTTSRHTYW